MTDATRILAGIMLISIVTIEFGGFYLTRVARGLERMTEFQKNFARAGHAHAGVLVSLGLICQLYADQAGLSGAVEWIARLGVPVAAILMPAGFFASSMGREVTTAGKLIILVWLGALSLAAGVLALGIGLLTA
ncbi:hypothetical protein [Longispora albida]|uniref:hypothetical protein n=1 Tax=Longispora albida TaxID=203523 RepID=UPI000362F210|nr:hypothetical protein [Longispora albida]